MSRSSATENTRVAVIDERAVHAWLRPADDGSSEAIDVPLCLTVLEMLLDVVATSLFIVAGDGEVVVANTRGIALLERHGELLLSFLRDGAADPSAGKLASWSAGPFCGKRRCFSLGSRGRHALVFVEEAETSPGDVIERAAREWMLTARQEAVFRLLLDGHSNKEISEKLGVAPRTVEVHITALFEKAGVDSRARLIARTWVRDATERGRSRAL